MKTCLFGGSFDPVHAGHLHIALAAVQQAQVDKVIFLPAACSPFKTGKATFYTDAQRMSLLRYATADLPWAEVSDADLRLPPPSWSWRLVETYKNEHPQDELFWLMGTDQWEQLHKWARYDYLIRHLTFIVYHRGTPPLPREGVRSVFISGNHPASSSAIRQAILSGSEVPPEWIPKGISHYPMVVSCAPEKAT